MSKSEGDKFQLKSYSTKQGKMVAACDAHLMGKSFKEGNIHLKVNKEFYAGNKVGFDAVKQELEGAQIANLVGENLISQLLMVDYLSEAEIKEVDGVPHSQVFVI